MSKLVLEWEAEIDFELIGVSSFLPNYRFIWTLNKLLKTNFARQRKDIDLPKDKSFSWYTYLNEEDHLEMTVICNRCTQGYFIPELKQMDYFILTYGVFQDLSNQDLAKKINQINQVNTALSIDANQLKSKDNFMFY